MASDKKEKILESAIALLKECDDVKEVTTRRIAERAAVNPAMINYYYGPKDDLLVESLKRILAGFLTEQDIEYDRIRVQAPGIQDRELHPAGALPLRCSQRLLRRGRHG